MEGGVVSLKGSSHRGSAAGVLLNRFQLTLNLLTLTTLPLAPPPPPPLLPHSLSPPSSPSIFLSLSPLLSPPSLPPPLQSGS